MNSLRIRTYWSGLLALLLFPHAAAKVTFTSKYVGKTVTRFVGSSVNFTWSFSGNVDTVDWGLQNTGGNDIADNGLLISLTKNGPVSVTVPSAYNGRVSGSGDASSGHVIFTLMSIQEGDERFYGCRIKPTDVFNDQQQFDPVYLAVKEAPQISLSSGKSSYNEGSAVIISCTASGTPDPDVHWIRNAIVIFSGKKASFLTFSRVSRTDAGRYTCKANNSAGTAENYATLVVHYRPTIKEATASTARSWIGQTVALRCVSDGVPTPTLTWYKPDGSQINSVTATENIVNVKMSVDQDFGGYKCDADNGLITDFKIVKIDQIKKPGSPAIAQSDIQSTSLTVKWTAPVDNGGSPITAYRVVILKGSTEIKNENITDPGTTSWITGDLERDTEYTVKLFARNSVFEGPAVEKVEKTKYEGVPAAATIDDLPNEVTDDTITLKWSEPQSNGKVITQYTVYQRIVTDGKPGEWTKLKTIIDVSVRELKVELEKGKMYEFVVTATNELGESLKEGGKIRTVRALEVPTIINKSKSKATVVEGNVLYLVCEAKGYPNPSVTWKKNGKVLQTNITRTDFIIDDTSGKNAGKYECEASNTVGTVSYTVEVTIKGSSCNETTLHIVYNIVILALLIIFLILRRLRSCAANLNTIRRKKCAESGGEPVEMNPTAADSDQQSSSNTESGDSRTYVPPSSGDYVPLHPSARSWEINREQVKIIKVVGKGAFSQVAKATAWNIRDNEDYTTVAVKMLKANAPESDRRDLLSELELMKKLKPHPHVIKLMGCVTASDPLLVLIEYVPYGDLLGYLRKSRGLSDTYFKDPDVKPQTSLTAEQLMRFTWQVADGMLYLSSRKIIHRDLAARNVLVGEGEKCKVTDFGMARNVQQDDIYTKQSRGRLPVKWTAYEALLYGTYTTQSDVWSYGVLLYEILTVGGSPYPGINARQIARKLQDGFRMPKPKHVDKKLYQIMLKCWEENPSDRPTFAKLKDTMKEMERKHRTYVNLKQYDNSLYANVEDLTAE